MGKYGSVGGFYFLHYQRIKEVESYHENYVSNNNIDLFVHINLNVIFSDDDELIRAYYSRENETLHNSIVQAAFDAFTAQYGTPDTSWMIDVPVDR